ncbi:MAG: 4Fe-4S dicluster domain-containing protein [Deltaproteobacteria bacterium]|nr:4Fe-4S dicluster domain-containing protein [Deltaproteobacteria bacterium]
MTAFGRIVSTAREALYGRRIPRLKTTRSAEIVAIEPPTHVRLTIEGLVATVEVGQVVSGGELVARSPRDKKFQRRIHASLTGSVTAVSDNQIIIEGEVPERPLLTHSEPEWISPAAITDTAREAGLIGMGGGMFPVYVKLGNRAAIEVVLVNGCESEPYMTADSRVLEEQRDEVGCGVGLAMHAVRAKKGLIVERETHYPGGYERLLIRDALGREVPSRGLPRDVGTLVMNVQSARALHEAVCLGRPLIDRVITVDGGAVGRPGNYRVPIGTEVGHVLDVCEVDPSKTAAILSSGPMMGSVAERETPVAGGTGAVLALTAEELKQAQPEPCIRCGQCLEVCPFDLPAAYLIEHPSKAVLGCIECGACQFICPARIPLVSQLQRAKAVVTAWD